jgi:hypothetical protein
VAKDSEGDSLICTNPLGRNEVVCGVGDGVGLVGSRPPLDRCTRMMGEADKWTVSHSAGNRQGECVWKIRLSYYRTF